MNPEPRHEGDYTSRQVDAARRVLVDVGQVVASPFCRLRLSASAVALIPALEWRQSEEHAMNLQDQRHEILRIAALHGARNLRVFGSMARGEDRPDSDLDLLVEMEFGRSVLDLIGLGQDLEDLLQRRVDVLTDDSVHHALRARILAEARPL